MQDYQEPQKSHFAAILIPWILFILSLGASAYLWIKVSHMQQVVPQTSQDQVDKIIKEVGALLVLPNNETPTIATVTDLSKLAGQPFFANAKLGDIVLIYSKAQKAILYDPSQNKIVELAPINTTNTAESATSVPASSSPSTSAKKK